MARRLVAGSRKHFSSTFVAVAIASIALGVAITLLAVSILTGFKKEIREKVAGFAGHVQVTGFTESLGQEPSPVEIHQPFIRKLAGEEAIIRVNPYATKAGIIKTPDHIQGVLLKGVDTSYDWEFFRSRLESGHVPDLSDSMKSNDVIISSKLASLMNLSVNDDLRMYFVTGNNTLGRKFRISGLYNTGLGEFDKLYVIGDIRHVQKLNGWTAHQAGGFEIHIKDFDEIDRMGVFVYHQVGFNLDASTIKMLYPQIFDWLSLQDINVMIIMILIIVVSSTTIISTLLILILERTSMIGILKALGMRNAGIRRVFLYNAMYIVSIGLIAGNLLALGLLFIQKQFSLVTLSEESYYMTVIPVNIDLINTVLINAGALLICWIIFLIPSLVIARIPPVKAIRFS